MKVDLSKLGFGLSSIAGSGNFSHQEKLIRTAIDAGITHFDVAPYYGSGDAEKILGDILASCPETVTITTKFGLMPVGGGMGGSLLRSALRPIFRRMSALKKIASTVVSKTHQPKALSFNKGDLINSMDASIKKLRRPVDVFLLHDVEVELAQNSDLLEELEEIKRSAKTRLTGISGTGDTLLTMVNWRPEVYEVAQLENSLKCPAPIEDLKKSGADVITHRAIQGGLEELLFLLRARPTFKNIWEREIGIDPASREDIANALIELAMHENPEGTVLFSSTNPERIRKVAGVLSSPKLGAAGCKALRSVFSEVYLRKEEVA